MADQYNSDILCYFCNRTAIDDVPVKICNCPNNTNFAHKRCILLWVKGTNNRKCLRCYTEFINVKVTPINKGCCNWLRRDRDSRLIVIGGPILLLFFFYIVIVGYVNYATVYWWIPSWIAIILFQLIQLYLIFFMLMFIQVCITICQRFYTWKYFTPNYDVFYQEPVPERTQAAVTA